MKEMPGAHLLIRALRDEGVDTIFGYPGGVLLPLYDALFGGRIRHLLTRHEQAAAHAADGYSRASGRIGVVLATSGPGATNLVTGIATAYMDSVPLVALTGQVPTAAIGSDAFQEADITGITRPITKHSYLVRDARDLPRVVREAFHIAGSGRPGPVLIDLPKDVLTGAGEYRRSETVEIRGYKPNTEGHPGQVKRALRELVRARRPVIYMGGGVVTAGAGSELLVFAQRHRVPVVSSLLGLGGFPGDHPLFFGMLGMHGTYAANMAVHGSDLLMAVGARFDDRVTGKTDQFAPGARVVHVDIEPSSISKNVEVHVPVVGDARAVLAQMNKLGEKGEKGEEAWEAVRSEWLRVIEGWRDAHPLSYDRASSALKPQAVIEKLCELAPADAVICTEVGQNQMWTAQFYTFRRPRTLVSSGGLGTMGFGFPAAIGAQVACPGRLVVDVAGDGSFQMNIQELATVAQHRIPVKVVILDNCFLGMVRQWQELFYGARYSSTCLMSNPDFVRIAEAYGVKGIRIEKPSELERGLLEALRHRGPAVVDCRVDREEGVYPMVPAGAAINQMILGPEKKKVEKRLRAVGRREGSR
jgi:acetolactate synthase-1/2/3 large subunit